MEEIRTYQGTDEVGAKFKEEEWKEEQCNSPTNTDHPIEPALAPPASPEVSVESKSADRSTNRKSKNPRRNSKPFEREPVRDKVGQGRKTRVA